MSSNSDLTTITSSSDSKYKRKSSSKKYEKEKKLINIVHLKKVTQVLIKIYLVN